MSIELNHTIVHAKDKHASAQFLAGILAIPVAKEWGPFVPVPVGPVTLEFLEVGDAPIQSQHYAFLVSDDVFDAAFARIRDAGIGFWADPFHHEPGRINHEHGGRGVYFDDPDGHSLELQTAPYGDLPS